DLGSGIGVNIFGYSDKEWVSAVTEQLNTIQHTSNLYYTDPCAKLAEIMCKKTGMKKVFFSNSGAEANECAIKIARKYASEKKGKDFYNIVTLNNSFHGRTLTTLSATGQEHFHKLFTPLTDGFIYADSGDINGIENIILNNKVAAVLIECVQGEGGVNVQDPEFVKKLEYVCNQNDVLLIIDEVQTGNGRCGELYAYMHYGIKPDVVTTAKGLGAGLPIGACLIGEKAENILGFGDHGSTFGGNPVTCAGALNVISRIDDKLLQSVREKSDFIFSYLAGKSGIESVSGLGLMIGIKTKKPAKEVVLKCLNLGVMCLTAKDKVRLLPPLNISIKLLKKALDVIIKVSAE
ncbi:MAG: aminotransferase class III-fold pyridoxal phosphate-dependent enzyme, partial [Clostridia bacterium]|nr:aminotransferase class III-fold pyridoxal phosphate-dependent enzyme [Clostridia bacterium]